MNKMATFLTKINDSWISIETRHQCIMMFHELLKIPYSTALELEKSVCAIQYSDKSLYIEHAKRICFNVKCNPTLLTKYKPKDLPLVTDEEMARGTLLEKIKEQENQRSEAVENMLREKYENVNKSAEGSLMRCKTCGSTDIAWQQKQTRGADESMTIFCTCSNCKTRWKMS